VSLGALSRAWEPKYREYALVVIGVHAPEFAFEKNPSAVHSTGGNEHGSSRAL
jgi:hypothetical protein